MILRITLIDKQNLYMGISEPVFIHVSGRV